MRVRRRVGRRSTRAPLFLALLSLGLPAGAALALDWAPPPAVLAARPARAERAETRWPALLERPVSESRELGTSRSAFPVPVAQAAAPPAVQPVQQRVEASPDEIAALVRDLADDDVRGNAGAAVWALERLGKPAHPALLRALSSFDRQQRQLAGFVLYRQVKEPTPDLLAVAVEALEHDRWPFDPGPLPDGRPTATTCNVTNARRAIEFLSNHPDEARPLLLNRLQSPDGQQRFLAASLLAAGRTDRGVDLTCRVLIEHLQDNDVRGDARAATAALSLMGDRILPQLRSALGRSDAQGRAFVSFLIECAETPGETSWKREQQFTRHGLEAYTAQGADIVVYAEGYAAGIPDFDDRSAGVEPAPAH